MGRSTKVAAAVAALALLAGCATVRVSVASDGGQANGSSDAVAIGGDGRFVAFASSATNLVPRDTNGQPDVFVRDRKSGTTRLVSVAADGGPANGASSAPSISADGRIVAFTSSATNLIADQPASSRQSYVRNLATGMTTLLSQQSGFAHSAGAHFPRVSADGRFVTFQQVATSSSQEDGLTHIFVHDVDAATTELVSTPPDGPAPLWADNPSISADGRYVAYVTQENTGPGTGPNEPEGNQPVIPMVVQEGGPDRVVVLDRTTGLRVTAPEARITSKPGWQIHMNPSISADGRFVAFSAYTLSLVPGGTNDVPQVWLWDTHTDRMRNVSRLSGTDTTTWGLQPSVSRDGRRVAFLTTSYGATTDYGPLRAVIYDRRHGGAPKIDLFALEAASGPGPVLALSASGEDLAFTSSAADLVRDDTNASSDVFVRSLRDASAFQPPKR